MLRLQKFFFITAISLLLSKLSAEPVFAAITPTGDVTPDPASWNTITDGYVGNTSIGSLSIDEDSHLYSKNCYLGYANSAAGELSVNGTGATWTNSASVYVGHSGNGTLNISDGAAVTVNGSTYVAYNPDSAGTIHFGTGGTLTTYSLLASLSQLTGEGTINTNGLISDTDLAFDSTHDLQQTFQSDNVTINLNQSSYGALGAGYAGESSLMIRDGKSVTSSSGILGFKSGSYGTATVDGASSFWWMPSASLTIGRSGSGILNITNQGHVTSAGTSYVGLYSGSSGVVHIDGINSKWTVYAPLYIGNAGSGTLNITGGGGLSNSSGQAYIGYLPGSTGVVTVNGSKSLWSDSSALSVGEAGAGTLNIQGGGAVRSGDAYIGSASGSKGTVAVDGSASTWTHDYSLYVGNEGDGKLNITGGGYVYTPSTSYYSFVGFASGSTGEVNVDGAGSKWNEHGLQIGRQGKGALNVTNGGIVSGSCTVGYATGSIGTVKVDGSGSKLTPGSNFYIGYFGNGMLYITHGGAVNSRGTSIGDKADSVGSSTVDGAGSIWSNSTKLYVGNTGYGTLEIINGGILNDSNSYSSIGYASGSIGVAKVDGIGSAWIHTGYFYVGVDGIGTLNISNGGTLASENGSLGQGTVTVEGPGSSWTNTGLLYIARSGNGKLYIRNGGTVINNSSSWTTCYIGDRTDSTGVVQVDGIGSSWSCSSDIGIGHSGSGTLFITGGGKVTAPNVSIGNNQSLLAIDVGTGSQLTVNNGTGAITNNGKIRILAGANSLPTTVYKPLSAATWSGTGSYQAVGGTWNSLTHEFTVSGVQAGTSGTPVVIDRFSMQRMLIGLSASNWELGASFASTETSTLLTLTATAINDGPLDALKGMLGGSDSILGGWDLAADGGYTVGDPIYLSFKDGIGGNTTSSMHLWSYDGTKWSPFDADDLAYDGSYASFTATSMGCYAVTVPEPGMIMLLGLGIGGVLIERSIRRRV